VLNGKSHSQGVSPESDRLQTKAELLPPMPPSTLRSCPPPRMQN
jgi:hypothetical protein